MRRVVLLFLLLLLGGGLALAQQSSSHRLDEHTFNAGGHPQGGAVLTSASFRLTLGAIGDGLVVADAASKSFAVDAGFVAAYPPPGDLRNVLFTDATTLVWDPDRSAGTYNLYQGLITRPFDPEYGLCQTAGLPDAMTGVPAIPAVGEALFVLPTVENRLGEEGTKGSDSSGSERANASPCP